MKTEEQSYWQIHDFLKGHLDDRAREAFVKLTENDPSLAEEVEKHRLANRLVIQNRLKSAEQTALKVKDAYKRNLFYKKLGTIGAALLVLTGGTYYFFNSAKETTIAPIATQQEMSLENKQEELPDKPEEIKQVEVSSSANKVSEPKLNSGEVPIASTEKQVLVQEEPVSSVGVLPTLPEPLALAKEESPIPLPVPKEEPKTAENACSSVHLQASVFASPTCKGEHGGSIVVSRIKGGKSPYHTEIRSEKGATIENVNSLPKGTYSVLLFDDQHCSTRIDHVEVKEKICELEEKVFNPFLDELFELPVSTKNGTFVVYEKNGNVFYKKDLIAHEKEVWDGVSQNGEMETGHFTYEIIYQDGSRKQGTLTITR